MSTVEKYPLTFAQQAFAVANTPLFLIRKLRVDPEVHQITREVEGEEILSQLKATLSSAPKSLRESVLPYVLLVSLSLKNDPSFLKAAKGIPQSYEDDWLDYLRQVLLETYRTTIFSSIEAQPMAGVAAAPSNVTDSGANAVVIRVPS